MLAEYERKLFGEPYAELEHRIMAHCGLGRALTALAERYADEQLRVIDLARAAGMSPTVFRERFRRTIGITPRQLLVRYRIKCALHLLSAGHNKISEISERVGFADITAMEKAFKRILGASPTVVREAIGAGCRGIDSTLTLKIR